MEKEIKEEKIQNFLGNRLKAIRTVGGFGKLEDFCKELSISKNTLGGYERAERLPDLEFLALFSDKTKSNFVELLILRLTSSSSLGTQNKANQFLKLTSDNNLSENNSLEASSKLDKHVDSLRNAVNLLISNYDGSNINDRDMIVTMFLSELQYTKNLTTMGASQITEVLQQLREIEEKIE